MSKRIRKTSILCNAKILAWGILANLGVKRARKHQLKLGDLQ